MENELLNRKEKLVLTAVEIIGELGIQGLSTREIAKRQGISEGALFRHYKTKNDLMLAVLDHYSQYDNDIMKSIKIKKLRPREAIIYLTNAYAEYYENYPAIMAIDQAYDVLACDPNLADKVKEIYIRRTGFISDVIMTAKRDGDIASDIECEKLADILYGIFRGICLKWKFRGYAFSLKEYTLSTLEQILNVFHFK